jgi:hypothetical protein
VRAIVAARFAHVIVLPSPFWAEVTRMIFGGLSPEENWRKVFIEL